MREPKRQASSAQSVSSGSRAMNAPFHIDRPEVVDPASSTSPPASEQRSRWLCITMLIIALLATVVWIATLGWLVVKAFSLW
jgi:hypothetical protein